MGDFCGGVCLGAFHGVDVFQNASGSGVVAGHFSREGNELAGVEVPTVIIKVGNDDYYNYSKEYSK